MDKQIQAFFEEAYELLHELEQLLLDLDNTPDSSEIVASILRILHTLKGTSAMFAFNEISDFVHKIEAVFVHFKNSSVDKEVVNSAITAADAIKKSLHDNSLSAYPEILTHIDNLFERYQGLKQKTVKIGGKNSRKETKIAPVADKKWLIRFTPCPEFYRSGNTPDRILADLEELGVVEVEVDCCNIPRLGDLNPELNYLGWHARLTTHADLNAVRDVFIFVEDLAEIEIEEIAETSTETVSSDAKPENVKAKSLNEASSEEQISEQNSEQIFAPADLKTTSSANETTAGQVKTANNSSLRQAEADSIFLKENTEKMIALLGDLVTVQAKLNQKAALHGNPEMISISNELENITDELRDCAMHLSMFPIGMVFKDFQYAVDSVSNKKVLLSLSGSAVEIDRSFQYVIKDFLTGLLAVLAQSLFKADVTLGKINVQARHHVGKALLEITAQGNNEVIADFFNNKDEEYTEALSALTAELHKTHGAITVDRIEPAKLLISISLPLNLAIIESLMVQIGNGYFLLPLADIEECIELSEEDQNKSYRKNVAVVRGQFVPYLHLREKFYIDGKPPKVQQIVILKLDQARIGMVVDQVVGEYQTAIKTWGKFCNDVAGINGAAILGDGDIALLIDFKALINEEKELLERNLKEHNHGI